MQLTGNVKVLGNGYFNFFIVGRKTAALVECGTRAGAAVFRDQWTQLEEKPEIKYIVALHSHFDHIGGYPVLKQMFPEAKLVASAPAKTAGPNIANTRFIAVRLRGGDPWSLAAFERLLKHGKRRQPAKDHLADPDVRYLLVTNADVSGAARNLLVADFEERPGHDDFPASLRDILPDAPEGRVAIYASLTPKLVEYEIEHILTTILRVPKDRQGTCLATLREEAKAQDQGDQRNHDELLATGEVVVGKVRLDLLVGGAGHRPLVHQQRVGGGQDDAGRRDRGDPRRP